MGTQDSKLWQPPDLCIRGFNVKPEVGVFSNRERRGGKITFTPEPDTVVCQHAIVASGLWGWCHRFPPAHTC